MNGNSIALDSSEAVHLLNDVPAVVQWLKTFGELCMSVTAIGELRFGALKSGKPAANLSRVDDLVKRCRVLNVQATTAEVYARLRIELRRKGRPIPENDLWIAAACVEHAVCLATEDAHFGVVDGLRTMKCP